MSSRRSWYGQHRGTRVECLLLGHKELLSVTEAADASCRELRATIATARTERIVTMMVKSLKSGEKTLERFRYQFPDDWLYSDQLRGEWSAYNEILKRKNDSIQEQLGMCPWPLVYMRIHRLML